MDVTDNKKEKFYDLKLSLKNLIGEYQQSCDLINDQIQAVIYSDLAWLDSLVEQQLSKYESLETLENDFKLKLQEVFESYGPEHNYYSLTLLMDKLEKPTQELNWLRENLHDQVEKTQQLREQLMNLLQFASDHNVTTFEKIVELSNGNSSSYGADGRKKQSSISSVAINQKA